MLPIVVFDTNVLLSGVGWRGAPYRCLELARSGLVEGRTCPELLDELARKLQFRLRFSTTQVADTLADLLSFLWPVTIPNLLNVVSADPEDNKVLECAVVARAPHIVTGDRRHLLPLGHYRDILIVSAADFLAILSPSH